MVLEQLYQVTFDYWCTHLPPMKSSLLPNFPFVKLLLHLLAQQKENFIKNTGLNLQSTVYLTPKFCAVHNIFSVQC